MCPEKQTGIHESCSPVIVHNTDIPIDDFKPLRKEAGGKGAFIRAGAFIRNNAVCLRHNYNNYVVK